MKSTYLHRRIRTVTDPFRSVPSIYFESDHSLVILKRSTCQVHLCTPCSVSVSCIRFRNATSVYAVKIRYFYELHRRTISRYSLNLPQKDLGLNNKMLGDEVTASTLIAWYSSRTLVFDRRNFPVLRSTLQLTGDHFCG